MSDTIETTVLDVPHEEQERVDSFGALVERLSCQSVTRHFDAYADVAWDDERFRIDPTDPRWELSPSDPLGATSWNRVLPRPTRAHLGLDSVASKMKTGLEFESVLKRGLLEYASTLPNGSAEFRYAYHEVIEEAQHSLIFQEFVTMAQMMLRPSRQIIARYDIPRSVIEEAYSANLDHRSEALASMAKLRRLWIELGLAGPLYRRLWGVLGLWDHDVDPTRHEGSA